MAYRVSQPLAATQFPDDDRRKARKEAKEKAKQAKEKAARIEAKKRADRVSKGLKPDEAKVNRKIAKYTKKMEKVSDKKDARQTKAKDKGYRLSTRKEQMQMRIGDAPYDFKGKTRLKYGKPGKVEKSTTPDNNTKKSKTEKNKTRKLKEKEKKNPKLKQGPNVKTNLGGFLKSRMTSKLPKKKYIIPNRRKKIKK